MTRAEEAAGWSVLDLSAVGGGAPDQLVGRNGLSVLVEIKNKSICETCDHAEADHALQHARCFHAVRGRAVGCACPAFRAKTDSEVKLRPLQEAFKATWKGVIVVAYTPQDAVEKLEAAARAMAR